jgi:putative ABC transport system ATP-binding protein
MDAVTLVRCFAWQHRINVPMNADISPAVRAEGLCRHYRMGSTVIRAVEDVSLEVASGEFTALLGSSGSGKSTLLNLMAGLDRPTSGRILVQGRDLSSLSSEELARYRRQTVGIVFQAFNLIGSMTVEENVELPLRFAEVERSERERRAREALERVGLAGRLQHRPAELSGGEQQRVSLARAIVNRPALLLADEPTGNLDSATGESIMLLLSELNQTLAMTVLMVTHERPLADRFATRILQMADGRLLQTPAEVAGPGGRS